MHRMEKKRAQHEKLARHQDNSGLRAPPINLAERDLLQSILDPIFGTPSAPGQSTPTPTSSTQSIPTTSTTPTTTSTTPTTTSTTSTTPSTTSTSTTPTSTSTTSLPPSVSTQVVAASGGPSSSPSPSASSTPAAHKASDFAHNTGAQAAVGVVCGLIGLVGLVWLITFAVRRRQKHRDEQEIVAALHTPTHGFHGSPDDANYQTRDQYVESDTASYQGLVDPVSGRGSSAAGAYGTYGAPPELTHNASYANPYPQQHTSPDYGAPLTPMPQPPSSAYAPAMYNPHEQATGPAQVALMRETADARPVSSFSAMDPYGGMEYGAQGGRS